MAKLKITRVGGETVTLAVSPAVEFAFESKYNDGFHKRFRLEERQTDMYWLAWECLRSNGQTVPEFGLAFIQTLVSVTVEDDDSPNE